MKGLLTLLVLISLAGSLSGCGIRVTEDHYSLDEIEGDITCEYRIGKDAMWADECVESDVTFDKQKFLDLFHEFNQYDPVVISKDPDQCDLKMSIEEQLEEYQAVRETEFNVRAVFGDEQRNVSIYRHKGKLYFKVLVMGGRTEPEKEGVYFMELSEEMSEYWRTIIEAVEADL